MKTATFKEWDLDSLDAVFNLKQVWGRNAELEEWENNNQTVDDFEKRNISTGVVISKIGVLEKTV